MLEISRRTFALYLAMTPHVGGKTVARIQARNDLLGRQPSDFLTLAPEALQEEYGLAKAVAEALSERAGGDISQIQELETKLTGMGVRMTTSVDANYPSLIEEMDEDPPGILFLFGNLELLKAKTFAVMSSRGADEVALSQIEKLVEEGVLNGETLVSGHDRPEYQRAAVVPLRWGAPRIMVFDRGLFKALGPDLKTEPFRTARLWRYEFDPKTDLAVSPFRPDAAYIGINNKIRDRLCASLARRIDFAYIRPVGGMKSLAVKALKAGRAVRISPDDEGIDAYSALGAKTFTRS